MKHPALKNANRDKNRFMETTMSREPSAEESFMNVFTMENVQ